MNNVDLWGDLITEPVRTPITILKEQAALLGSKTHQMVMADVKTEVDDEEFVHAFELVVPSLQYYRYRLFTVQHSITQYPVLPAGTTIRLRDEEAFTNWLRGELSSNNTKRIIANLLAQAKA
jgi:hypothetical protein